MSTATDCQLSSFFLHYLSVNFDLYKYHEIIKHVEKLCLTNGNSSFRKTNIIHVIVMRQMNYVIII
jgi:hypothetical protein